MNSCFILSTVAENTIEISPLETAYYVSQIIIAIVAIIGIPIAMYQLINAKNQLVAAEKESSNNRKREIALQENRAIQKSIDLAGYYKDNILEQTNVIKFIYKTSGIYSILEKINKDKMMNFDEYELSKLLTTVDLKKIQEIPKKPEFMKILVSCGLVSGFGEKYIKKEIQACSNTKDGNQKVIQVDVDAASLLNEYAMLINRLLNNLEFFAMHFTHKTADESVVYQSLHLTYLEVVRLLYFDISSNNKKDGIKLYTNVIDLYCIWYKKSEESESVRAETYRNVVAKGKEIQVI